MLRYIMVLFFTIHIYSQQVGHQLRLDNVTISDALLKISERAGYDVAFLPDSLLLSKVNAYIYVNDIMTSLMYLLPENKYSIEVDHNKKRIVVKKEKKESGAFIYREPVDKVSSGKFGCMTHRWFLYKRMTTEI